MEDLTLSSGNVSKAAALQRRVSVYSQGTPDTPTFQDSAFFVSSSKSDSPRLRSTALFLFFSFFLVVRYAMSCSCSIPAHLASQPKQAWCAACFTSSPPRLTLTRLPQRAAPTCSRSATLRCVKKWRPRTRERQRVSFLHALRVALLEKLRRSRSFSDLSSLWPRPKSSLEVYVSARVL